MNAANHTTLWTKYPTLFGYDGNVGLPCECGDGWFKLIDELCAKLVELGPHAVASQVKEKFGTLRFYIIGASEAMMDLIIKAEEESSRVCENCGVRGYRHVHGMWVATLCRRHGDEWKAK